MITGFNGITPQIPSSTYVAHSADIIGNVVFGNDVSVWHNSVIRGDFNSIVVEDSSNNQDNSVLHVDSNEPLHIGTNTTIGHGCIIHGCTIGNSCLIGMGSLIMNRAMIGSNCIIGAGTLITQDTKIPDNSIVLGRPGIISKQISQSDLENINSNATAYVALKNKYLNQ